MIEGHFPAIGVAQVLKDGLLGVQLAGVTVSAVLGGAVVAPPHQCHNHKCDNRGYYLAFHYSVYQYKHTDTTLSLTSATPP